jgi:hypothetical protein
MAEMTLRETTTQVWRASRPKQYQMVIEEILAKGLASSTLSAQETSSSSIHAESFRNVDPWRRL